jgi:hypothetical protein
MKKLTIITALILCSCGPSTSDLERQGEQLLNDPVMSEYYTPAYLKGLRQVFENARGNKGMLEDVVDLILEKNAEAEAEIAVQRELEKM